MSYYYNTTFYSNSQSLAKTKNEFLGAKLVSRIIFTSVTLRKKIDTHTLKSDGKIFVLEEYFNAEPVNSPNGEWQLFPDALKLDLKDNASLMNNWSHESG